MSETTSKTEAARASAASDEIAAEIPLQPNGANYDDAITKAFVIATVVWGAVGMLVGLLIALQLAWWPANADLPALSFGRLRPLHTNAVIFAFAGNAIFAGIYYSTQRLCKARMFNDKLSWIHFWGWQLIIVSAAITLPAGLTQGKEYAELIWPIDIAIAVVWVIFAINFFGTLAVRKTKHLYVALWFYIATIITIAVLHIGNSLALPATLGRSYPIYAGMTDGLVQWWYGHNAVGFLLTTPFLGLMYYFLPKAANRPVYSYRLSIVHFWGLIFIYIWAGPHHLLFSALPDWAQTFGSVFSLALIAPSWGGMLNGLLTLRGAWDRLRTDPILKFFVVGITFYGMSTLEGPLMSLRPVNSLSHYTDWTIAHVHGGALGWVGFTTFATLYYVAPRVWKRPLYSVKLASNHFWIATIGILLYVVSMWTAGVTQGLTWRAVDQTGELQYWSFLETVVNLMPYYWVRALGGALYLTGIVMMAYNLYRTALDPVEDRGKREWLLGGGIVGTVSLVAAAVIGVTAYHIEWPEPTLATAAAAETTLVDVGSSRYRRMQCARCHGQRGQGGIVNVNYVDDTYPTLTTLAERMHVDSATEAQAIIAMLEEGDEITLRPDAPPFEGYNEFVAEYERIRDTIVNGREALPADPAGPSPEAMPAWGGRLDEEEIDGLIVYLISLYEWPE